MVHFMIDDSRLGRGFTLEWSITGHDDPDFNATESCCACGGGVSAFEHRQERGTCNTCDEPFVVHDVNHNDDDHDFDDFGVFCETDETETDENIRALTSHPITPGECVLQLEVTVADQHSSRDGVTGFEQPYRLEMMCDTVARRRRHPPQRPHDHCRPHARPLLGTPVLG